MPALVLFKRKWYVNGDDLFLPGLIEIFFRVTWLLAISIVFYEHHNQLRQIICHEIWMYYVGNLFFIPFSILLTAIVVYISTRGTIMDTTPRKHLPKILYLKMILALGEVVWNIIGTMWAYSKTHRCAPYVVTALKVYVFGGWIFFVIISIVVAVFFGFFQKRSVDSESYIQVWEDRCNSLFCCKSKKTKNKNALRNVAKIVAPFFQDSDLVPTDIAAGLLLVQEKQEQEDLEFGGAISAALEKNGNYSTRNKESINKATSYKMVYHEEDKKESISVNEDLPISIVILKDWMHIDSIKYYLRFAMGMYGWPLYIVMNMTCGVCKLGPYYRCCSYNHVPKGDNCCQCNMATFYKLTENSDVKLIHVSFKNEIFESPFIVSIDQKNSAVVIAIRGSLSLEDAITDMSAETECAKTSKLEFQCHKGILQTAYFVKNVLEEHSLLEKGFEETGTERIVVTGHSLGAGVAAILSILLKDKYEDVRCFSFAPPGGLLGRESSDYSKDFIVSAFFGDDIIPRMSLRNIEKLKHQIITCIKECPLPKYKILMNSLLCGYEMSRFVNEYKDLLDEVQSDILQHEPLFPPGVVLYVTENKNPPSCSGMCSCSTETCSMEWFSPDQFQEIRISSSMISDHFPDSLSEALDKLVLPPVDI